MKTWIFCYWFYSNKSKINMPVKNPDQPQNPGNGKHVRNRHPYFAIILGCNCGCNLPLLISPKP